MKDVEFVMKTHSGELDLSNELWQLVIDDEVKLHHLKYKIHHSECKIHHFSAEFINLNAKQEQRPSQSRAAMTDDDKSDPWQSLQNQGQSKYEMWIQNEELRSENYEFCRPVAADWWWT